LHLGGRSDRHFLRLSLDCLRAGPIAVVALVISEGLFLATLTFAFTTTPSILPMFAVMFSVGTVMTDTGWSTAWSDLVSPSVVALPVSTPATGRAASDFAMSTRGEILSGV